MEDKLSVIISAYSDHPLTIAHVREEMKSTRIPDEIIIVNDGGTPDLKDMLVALEKKTKIIYAEILPPKIPWNYTGARNLGIWLSSGNIIAIEDNDHIPDRTYYEDSLKAFQEHPEYLRLKTLNRWTVSEEDILTKPMEEWTIIGKRIPHQDVTMNRRELLLQLKGYDERFAGEYGWCATDINRRLKRMGVVSYNIGHQFVRIAPITKGLSYRNFRLAREQDEHIQSSLGILNFKYIYTIL